MDFPRNKTSVDAFEIFVGEECCKYLRLVILQTFLHNIVLKKTLLKLQFIGHVHRSEVNLKRIIVSTFHRKIQRSYHQLESTPKFRTQWADHSKKHLERANIKINNDWETLLIILGGITNRHNGRNEKRQVAFWK